MKFNVLELEKGKVYKYTYEEDENNKEISRNSEIETKVPVQVKIDIFRSDAKITVKGEVRAVIKFSCDRCLEEFYKTLYIPFYREVKESELVEGCWDDSEEIRQSIILSLPMKNLCKEDCLGLCPHCGTNLNVAKCSCKNNEVDERWGKLKKLVS